MKTISETTLNALGYMYEQDDYSIGVKLLKGMVGHFAVQSLLKSSIIEEHTLTVDNSNEPTQLGFSIHASYPMYKLTHKGKELGRIGIRLRNSISNQYETQIVVNTAKDKIIEFNDI